MRLPSPFLVPILLASTALAGSLLDHARYYRNFADLTTRSRNVAARSSASMQPKIQERSAAFLTEKAKPFEVNGTGLPEVPFDIGESYAGLLPISGDADESRKLFFWFFPSPNIDARDKVTVWFNGGPGCSSLHGLLSELGPFTWQSGTAAPTLNPYSWTNLTNMVFVEQPVGVGYTQGVPSITNEEELAEQFLGFYKQFVDTFDLHGHEAYMTGESYGGYYVPYVADAFIAANDTDYYNLKGMNMNDALMGDTTIQTNAAISPLADYWENLFYLNDTTKDRMHAAHEDCGYAEYIDKYLRFPPPQEPFQLPQQLQNKSLPCNVYQDVLDAILEINPCFEIWHFTQTCPHPYSVLGEVLPGDYLPPGNQVYFNRTDVQAALNVVVGTNWEQCSSDNVFGGENNDPEMKDTSVGPANSGALQRVIEHTNNVFIGSADLDYILSTNSTLLALQNVTFNGMRGLQRYPDMPFFVPYHPEYNGGFLSGAGIQGAWGSERGLTFYSVRLSGHELPGYAAGAAYRVMEVMLGKVKDLSMMTDFTTQSGQGDFGNGPSQ